LSSEIEPQLWIKGDAQQLSLLLRNLLDNAVHYTSPGGNIRLEVSGEGDEAVVRVTDDGAGIPLEAQTRVFERFYRVDRARSRDRGGTGLGLAIVKHVAELHGGTVDVQSELGAGSSFTTRIPAIPKHQVASPPLATEKETA
jgi:signal transduction histidine kinase